MSPGGAAWRVPALEVRDVRSWHRARITLGPGLTVLTGHNGAGKTSLVEAVVLAAVGASPRTSQLGDLVRHGERALHVRAVLDVPGRGATVRDLGYQARVGRRLAEDGEHVASLAAWRRPGGVLVFVPEELRAVKGPPAARRRGLDRVLEAVVPGFTEAVSAYGAALAQRNAVLRRAKTGDGAAVGDAAPWEAQMAAAGAAVTRGRRQGVAMLAGPFAHWLTTLGGEAGGAVRREASPARLDEVGDDGWEDAFRAYLADRRGRDAAAGMTLAGPHRDDLWIGWGDFDARRLGSQGEQRTAALALLLAHRDILRDRAARPILLLDDVFSELDPDRRRALVEAVRDGGQTIITTADTGFRPDRDLPGAVVVRVPDDVDAAA